MRDQNRNEIAEPSGDEPTPTVSYDTLLSQTSFSVPDPTWNAIGNPIFPKRDATDAPPERPGPRVADTGEFAESGMEDMAVTQRHLVGMPAALAVVTVYKDRLQLARLGPNRGRPAYAVMHPTRFSLIRFSFPNRWNLRATSGLVAGEPMGPPTRAFTVVGVKPVRAWGIS